MNRAYAFIAISIASSLLAGCALDITKSPDKESGTVPYRLSDKENAAFNTRTSSGQLNPAFQSWTYQKAPFGSLLLKLPAGRSFSLGEKSAYIYSIDPDSYFEDWQSGRNDFFELSLYQPVPWNKTFEEWLDLDTRCPDGARIVLQSFNYHHNYHLYHYFCTSNPLRMFAIQTTTEIYNFVAGMETADYKTIWAILSTAKFENE